MSEYYIYLKWGTLKSWKVPPEMVPLFQKYAEQGMSTSAMLEDMTDIKKQILCEIIDAFDGPISNDWTGETYSNKEDAKKYVMEYGD